MFPRINQMIRKIELTKINKKLDEEIEYLEGHVARANEERIKSWIWQTKHLKKIINRIK